MPLVGVVMGSVSDAGVVIETQKQLQDLGISFEIQTLSAHRVPELVREYALRAEERGIKVFIAEAGGSAALAGVLASWTTIPVIGVPLASSELKGLDSLLAIAQMPPGVPVACMAVGHWGARNAAIFAAQILGVSDEKIKEACKRERKRLQDSYAIKTNS